MNTNEFRSELIKRMPSYKWTVERPYEKDGVLLKATGIQTSGFNRISTLRIERRVDEGGAVVYKTYISGYGKRSDVFMWGKAGTIAKALRGMQDRCEACRDEYAACIEAIERGRLQPLKQ